METVKISLESFGTRYYMYNIVVLYTASYHYLMHIRMRHWKLLMALNYIIHPVYLELCCTKTLLLHS